MKHLLSLAELMPQQLTSLLDLSAQVKQSPERYGSELAGKKLGMLFEKPSTRTRVSFQVGMHELGGYPLVLNAAELQLGRGESVADTARVLSRYVDGVMARVNAHTSLVDLARHATIPVINGLSDLLHPCQALADYLTMRERFGQLQGLRVAYVGDGNNVAHSLAIGGARLGVNLTFGCPAGYQPDPDMIATAQADGAATGARIDVVADPVRAVAGAQVIYTDVWVSMGQDAERAKRLHDLAPCQVNAWLFGQAARDAIFMHCLPAHRGEEVTDEVADHTRSAIFDQAENRLHTQKAVLLQLMSD